MGKTFSNLEFVLHILQNYASIIEILIRIKQHNVSTKWMRCYWKGIGEWNKESGQTDKMSDPDVMVLRHILMLSTTVLYLFFYNLL